MRSNCAANCWPRGRATSVCSMPPSRVAEVADDQGDVRVTRVFAAVDCGRIVHPDLIRSQIEGGVVFGLTAALHGRIRIANAAPVESNFPQYPLLPFGRAPHVEVAIVPSDAEPGGVGEIGVPPIAPAVANALARLGRPRPRTLPIMG
jgi:isoquinoline 1-oxidoreductase beta subunit